VWRHCDGERDVAELARLAEVSEDLVGSALHEKDLLDTEPELMQSTILGISRREAIGRAARYGAAATAGSLIVSATAATPAMASSKLACGTAINNIQCCQCKNVCIELLGPPGNFGQSYCEARCAEGTRGGYMNYETSHEC
jgi:hypothetical protein